MQLTGQISAASFSQVTLSTVAFIGTLLLSTILNDFSHAETQAPHPMHASASTLIVAM
jgi:hypothetical protein